MERGSGVYKAPRQRFDKHSVADVDPTAPAVRTNANSVTFVIDATDLGVVYAAIVGSLSSGTTVPALVASCRPTLLECTLVALLLLALKRRESAPASSL